MFLAEGTKNLAIVIRGSHDLKVFGSVVVPNSIAMMDLLARSKIATQDALHHEPVLSDVTIIVGIRMVWAEQQDVAVNVIDTTLPVGMILSRESALAG